MNTFMKPAPISVLLCTIAALFLASCSGTKPAAEDHGDGQVVHWGYEAANGPEEWASMDSEWGLCAAGLEQSPIDLANAAPIELPVVEFHLPSGQEVAVLNQEGVIGALDNGHTIQINSKAGETMTVGESSGRSAKNII
jgi:carbonic anhydrase